MPNTPTHQPSRRDFIRTTGTVAAAAALASYTTPAFAASDTLRIGLIGCGGRGNGAAFQALSADPNTKLVALGDTFPDMVEASLASLKKSGAGDRVSVDEEHKFTGFDSYKGVIAASDVVILASPPAFRPEHIRAAVEAGKHVFCEKPIAVDGPGVRSVLETCKLAREKKVSLVSGLCYRYQFAKQDIIKRIHDGAIGDIIAMQTTYNTGGLWHKGHDAKWSDMEYQVRNWLYFDWLSGDHINEQHIHSLDKIAWAMKDEYPVKATASGGRVVRTDSKFGNIYDHFNTAYEWANGLRCFSSCRQWENAASTDVSDHIFGTKGTAHIQDHRIDFRDGTTWAHEPSGPDDMYQNEHNVLFASIRKGEPRNDEYMCHSTLMAIMARMSAYTGETITWDQALNSKESLVPQKLAWGTAPERAIAMPGKTAFA